MEQAFCDTVPLSAPGRHTGTGDRRDMRETKRLAGVFARALTLVTLVSVGYVGAGTAQARTPPKPKPGVGAGAGKAAPANDPAVQIEKDAEAAIAARKYAKAVTLLRGLVALRQNDPKGDTVFRLAEVYVLAGQYEEAIAELERFVRVSTDEARLTKAKNEIDRLSNTPAPFFEDVFRPEPAKAEAAKLFKLGQDFTKKKKFAEAVAHYEASMLLDPDLPGPYRASGAVYDKLGNKKKKAQFFSEYLRLRPDGKTADEIRKMLGKEKILGKVNIEASFACDVFVNGRPMGKKTPITALTLPEGRYTVTLVNQQYHVVRNMKVKVEAGKQQKARFDFGIVSLKLSPWARVKVDGRDLGLWDELGVPAGSYTLQLAAHDGSHSKELAVAVQDGKTVVIDKW